VLAEDAGLLRLLRIEAYGKTNNQGEEV